VNLVDFSGQGTRLSSISIELLSANDLLKSVHSHPIGELNKFLCASLSTRVRKYSNVFRRDVV